MAARLPQGNAGVAIGAEGPRWFMACHYRGPTTAHHLNKLLLYNELGLGRCPTTTAHAAECAQVAGHPVARPTGATWLFNPREVFEVTRKSTAAMARFPWLML